MLRRWAMSVLFMAVPVRALAGQLAPPPGPVAPTMKSLQQVAPRIPLTQETAPTDGIYTFVIDQPGSYYLTGDLEAALDLGGIAINSHPVTIDLNGFAIIGDAATTAGRSGINCPGPFGLYRDGVSVFNGSIRRFDGNGISGRGIRGGVVQNVRIADCGAWGMRIGPGSVVAACSVQECGLDGFDIDEGCIVRDCFARANGDDGFAGADRTRFIACTSLSNGRIGFHVGAGASLEACLASANWLAGITTGDGAVVTGCVAEGNSEGIRVGDGALVADCVSSTNSLHGFVAGPRSEVRSCMAAANSGEGILSEGDGVVRDCFVSGNLRNGIYLLGDRCRALGNSVSENGSGTGSGFAGILALDSVDGLIEANFLVANSNGVSVFGVGSSGWTIVRNVVKSSVVSNYQIGPGHHAGAQVSDPSLAGPWDNISN